MDPIIQGLLIISVTLVALFAISAWANRGKKGPDESKLVGILSRIVERITEQRAAIEAMTETLDGVSNNMVAITEILSAVAPESADTFGWSDEPVDEPEPSVDGSDDDDFEAEAPKPRLSTVRRPRR